jgi:hypothetical protein
VWWVLGVASGDSGAAAVYYTSRAPSREKVFGLSCITAQIIVAMFQIANF